ncbi:unnamed protein product [Amoebophrya sp. A120]|nr:unnamed protein product [Amoebophrya sp. A120]|eukprot:GSA120T00025438001.1
MAFLFPTVVESVSRPTVNQLIRSHKRKAPLRLYQYANNQYPKITKAVTGGVLGGLGDAVAQWLEKDPKVDKNWKFDWQRWGAFSAFNLAWAGVPLHFYINFLENKRRNFGLVQKMFVTHILYNPFLYFPSFYLCHGALMGQSFGHIQQRLQREMPDALAQCLQFWIPINFVQYTAISASAQVLFLSVANVAWCVILSSSSSDGDASPAATITITEESRTNSDTTISSSTTVQEVFDHSHRIRVEDGVLRVLDLMDPAHTAQQTASDFAEGQFRREQDLLAGELLPELQGKVKIRGFLHPTKNTTTGTSSTTTSSTSTSSGGSGGGTTTTTTSTIARDLAAKL